MSTETIPGKLKTARAKLGAGDANTLATSVMQFEHVESLLTDSPLRRPRHARLDDLESMDDLRVADEALAESTELSPYEDVRKELGLGG